MSSNYNEATKEGLSREIKSLREQCTDTYNLMENVHLDQNISSDNVGERALAYVDGLRTQIQNSETVIPTDENLIINQFLAEMKVKNDEVEKLTAFTRGAIADVDNEIQRLETHITQAEEALSKPPVEVLDVSMELKVQKAKDDFNTLKSELHGLIQSIFKNDSDVVFDIIGQMMKERLVPESNGYIQLTDATYRIGELLKDMKIASENPYNNMEIKLAY